MIVLRWDKRFSHKAIQQFYMTFFFFFHSHFFYDDTFISIPICGVDEKNPDVIPHDNSDDEYMSEEKQFERLYTPTKLNYVNNNSPTRTSPPVRFEKQVHFLFISSWLISYRVINLWGYNSMGLMDFWVFGSREINIFSSAERTEKTLQN